jgi:toxin ParE1/3/4
MAEKVIWSAAARADLHAIALQIAQARPETAEPYCLDLIARGEMAGDFPRAGRKLPELDDENVRELIHAPDRIIYELFANQPRPVILRIWHSARGNPELQRETP